MKRNLAIIYNCLDDNDLSLAKYINVEADCWEAAWQEITGIDINKIDLLNDKYWEITELILLTLDEDKCIRKTAHMVYNVAIENNISQPVMIPFE